MLIFLVEPDRFLAAEVRSHLATRGYNALVAHDFASASDVLAVGVRPAALYVSDTVPPLSGADLLALVERHGRVAGVPIVAHVADQTSLLAMALQRGGVHTLTVRQPEAIAASLARVAAALDDAEWRKSVLAWSQYLRRRVGRNRDITRALRARYAASFERALAAQQRVAARRWRYADRS